jgi:RHS repeat-associated protein
VDSKSGKIMVKMEYDEFGTLLSESYEGNKVSIPFGFAGGLEDKDTKLVRFGARDYDPEVGRWLSKDPTGFDNGINEVRNLNIREYSISGNGLRLNWETNLYKYSFSDPINYIDRDGEYGIAIPIVIGAIAAAIAARDITRYVQGQPSMCGKVEDFIRNQVSPAFRDFFGIPEPGNR